MKKKELTFTVEITSVYDEYSATTYEDDSTHKDPYKALSRKDELNKEFVEKCQEHLWAQVIVS